MMRAVLCLIPACLLALLIGCPGKQLPVEPGHGATRTGAEPAPNEFRRQTDEPVSSNEADLAELGLYSSPGELPDCEPEYEGSFVRYADVDGDDVREALIVAPHPDNGEPIAVFEVVRWTGEAWETWSVLQAPGGESQFDADSIAFAYDLNLDGEAELGLLLYEDKDGETQSNLYLYKIREDGLAPLIWKGWSALLGGIDTSENEAVHILDATDQFPGEEIIVTDAEGAEDEGPPRRQGMQVWCWVAAEECYMPALWYRSGQEFKSADDAVAAFENQEGEYWLENYEGQYYDPDLDDRWDPSRFEGEAE